MPRGGAHARQTGVGLHVYFRVLKLALEQDLVQHCWKGDSRCGEEACAEDHFRCCQNARCKDAENMVGRTMYTIMTTSTGTRYLQRGIGVV